MLDLIFKDESFKIIGICMEIHKTLGLGLKEVNYKREKRFIVKCKDKILKSPYVTDFVVFNSVVLEN